MGALTEQDFLASAVAPGHQAAGQSCEEFVWA